jgi:hypothetical protein
MSYDYSQHKATADNILAKIANAAREQRKAEQLVEQKERELVEAKAQLTHWSEKVLPDLMAEAEQDSLVTSDGLKIEIKEAIRASIPKEHAAKAFAWLRANQHDGLIRHNFVIEFDKDHVAEAEEFGTKLRTEGTAYVEKRAVHPQTLAAFVRQQLEAGNPIPQELFGVFRQKQARIQTRD